MNMNVNYFYCVNGAIIKTDLNLNISIKYYKELKKALQLKTVKNFPLKRVGKNNDGGYIMLDDFSGGVAYSFGIKDDVSWDDEMAQSGYQIYMYDPTIDCLPYEKSEFHFSPYGLAGIELPDFKLNTIEHFLQKNNHLNNKNMILKMDIEGAEWSFLHTVKHSILDKFNQIAIEFHNLNQAKSTKEWKTMISFLKKLNKTHQLIHLHGNNCAGSVTINGQCFPDVLEATYVKKSLYKFERYEYNLPLDIDEPNEQNRDDYVLGNWNYSKI